MNAAGPISIGTPGSRLPEFSHGVVPPIDSTSGAGLGTLGYFLFLHGLSKSHHARNGRTSCVCTSWRLDASSVGRSHLCSAGAPSLLETRSPTARIRDSSWCRSCVSGEVIASSPGYEIRDFGLPLAASRPRRYRGRSSVSRNHRRRCWANSPVPRHR